MLAATRPRVNVVLGSDCDPILELLDGLPLALAQTASFLRETAVDAKTYVDIYNRQFNELMGPLDGSRALLDYDKTTATTWVVSFREIERRSTNAANLLRLWAFFDNKELSHDLLAGAKNGPAGWCPEWLSEMASDQLRFLQATMLLRRYSMIETSEEAGNCYSIHPVVHRSMSYLEGDLKDNESAKLALILIGEGCPGHETQQDWILGNKLLPHAERWLGRIRVEPRRTWRAGDKTSIIALHAVGALFLRQGKVTEGEEALKWAMDDGKEALGPSHRLIFLVRLTLNAANIAGFNTEFKEAKDVLQQALLNVERTFGSDHPKTIHTLNLLGKIYSNYDDKNGPKEAERILKLALERSGARLGRPNAISRGVLADLGFAYQKQRKFTEAEQTYFLAIEEAEQLFVANNPNLSFTFTRLAEMYQSQGRVDEAIEMCGRALHRFQAILRTGHPAIPLVMRNMEQLQRTQGISNSLLTNTVAEGTNRVSCSLCEHHQADRGGFCHHRRRD